MRLHTVEITAFGPFAETARVDFDALFASSVFLLCGDTGAGKTTVLDAVCFALYGDVPGERGAARQLRSQHATAGVAPEVRLDLDVSGRRFRFTRSPAWQRPKKRGTGLTTEQARVLVEEHLDGAWVTRSTRLDEAGHLVGDLLGMNLDQFAQVVLLPQGQFDTFLRSSSEDRQRVLTQLFRTRRFEEVERWLVERRTTLRRVSEGHRAEVSGLLHRLSESADVALPEWDVAQAAQEGDLDRWVEELLAALASAGSESGRVLEQAGVAAEASVLADDGGRAAAALRAQHEIAVQGSHQLAEQADRIASDSARLEAAQRAEGVLPLAEQAARASSAAEQSARAATRAVAAVSAELDRDIPRGSSSDDVDAFAELLGERARRATARAAVARDFLPRARELEQATRALSGDAELVRAADRKRTEVAARVDVAPGQAAALGAELDEVRTRAARLGAAQARSSELGRLVVQFATAAELEFQVRAAQDQRALQHRITLDLREQLQDLRERRLAGMAAELASRMVVGSDCPVCGSVEHPAPATLALGATTREAEQAVRERIDDEEVALLTHDDHVHGYRARLVAVREAIGEQTLDVTRIRLDAADRDTAEARAAVAAEPVVRARHKALLIAQRADLTELAGIDTRLAAARERRTALHERVSQLSDQLTAILDEAGPGRDRSIQELATDNERSATLFMAARDALVEQQRGVVSAATARSATERASVERGFAGVDEAVAAALDGAGLDALREDLAHWHRLGEDVAAVLADPEVLEAVTAPAPDLAVLARQREAAMSEHSQAAAAARLVQQQQERVSERAAELTFALAAWQPVRAEHVRARSLSEFAEGRGSDNVRQMRLSAYVLASRLSQVVAAANERLEQMTDGRFLLEHTAQRGVGERRGGLSLLVRDQWTDELRDPVTLSGGETFVVSLALALGLADVVTGEAGGVRIDTLFVDEGFGSLDADTLELVMDTLDALRDGGRVVGVVSHVAELRTRIPTQLVVHKSRAGSTLEQRVGAG